MSTSRESSPQRRRNPTTLETPLLLSVPTAAYLLGIGTTNAWKMVHNGQLASVRLGARVLVRRADIERLIEENCGQHEVESFTDHTPRGPSSG